ncbi:MAG: noncanonical pyrimidine nucleotidase, YjjG family [Acidimicrobiia bacterium]|nr:noncanonical pyrimidine nucleotidase, YjjG family [Acidimicrobiia bacterium]
MRYQYILLDLDHTLLDSNASEVAAFDETMRSIGVDDPQSLFAPYVEINRALWAAVERNEISPEVVRFARFEQFVVDQNLDADPHAMAETFAAGLSNNGDLFPGALALLQRLSAMATLAMVTNGIGVIQRSRIERLGIGEYFAAVSISGEIGSSKPDSGIFQHAFGALGSPDRDRAIMVGDSLSSDIAGGNAYGVNTCWLNPTGRTAESVRPTYQIRDLAELELIVST